MPPSGTPEIVERSALPPSPPERFLDAVVDALTQPVFVKDRDYRFVFVNTAFVTMTGFTREQLLGRTDAELFPPTEAAAARHAEETVFGTGAPLDGGEESTTDQLGKVHVLGSTRVPLRGADGEVTHLVGILYDLTQLKDRERALRVGKEELEQLVSARTAELRHAQQELLKKERLAVVGQLAAGLAHQVRNPLASITNAASVIEQRLDAGKKAEATLAISIIKEEVLAANRIISDLLDYARVRQPRPIHVLLGELVETAFDARLLPAGIEVVRRVPEDLTAHADGDQLRTALRNIVHNAVEAMPRGGTLTIAAERCAERVLLRIFDTGDGVPAELLEQIFDPLVSSKPFGLGLGLTTARALIEAQGGKLRCAARVAVGTEMIVELPHQPVPPGSDEFDP